MAEDLSLLFRLRADNAQAKAVLTDTRAAVQQLRQSFGPQLTQTLSVTNKAFSDTFSGIGDNLNTFVAQRVPLVGAALVRVNDVLRGTGAESARTEKAIAGVAKSIQSIATESGKSVPHITSFLSKFVQIEGQAKRDKAAVDFFGASLGAKLLPELDKTSTALAAVSAESAATAGALTNLGHPIALLIIAIAGATIGIGLLAKELFELSKRAAEFQGRMFDLAQQTGLSVKTLSALEVMARTTGGSLDTIAQAVVLFQRKLDDAQNPLSKTAELFRKFNIDTSDTEGSLRSAFTALARMPEGFAQTNAAAELFGARGGKQVLAILKEANGDIDGTIKRLREMGILISNEAARAADKFNDDLALLELQLRALTAVAAKDLIPVIAEMIRAFGDLVQAIRPVVSVLSSIAGTALRPVAQAFKGLSLVVLALTGNYKDLAKAIKEAREQQEIKPLNVPALAPVPLPGEPTPRQAASDVVNEADAVLAAVKRKAAEQNQALSEAFERGRRTRQQQASETIADNKRVLEAEQGRIDAELRLKEQEIKALDEAQEKRGEIVRRDTEDYRAITAQIIKLQQERLDNESRFEITSREIRARAAKEAADARRNQIANDTDLLANEFDRQIKIIEAQIERGATAEEAGLTIIEQLEQAKIDARIEGLEEQKRIGFLTVQNQIDLDNELKKLTQERDLLADEQANRRLEREQDAAERTRDILIANLDTLLQLEQIAGQRRIDTIRALAERRVITEEEAAKQILKIQLDLIDDEIEATRSKITAAGSIADKDERIRIQSELNNQIKILTEERKSIQAAGDRDIEDRRRKDLENERRYADELIEIKERVRDIEREAAEEVIRLMVIGFARRRDVIRARLQADIADENARHRQAEETIRNLERENQESNATAQEKLEAEQEINRLREAELDRHLKREAAIKAEAKQDEKGADPIGRLELDIDSLNEFKSVIEDSIVPLGEILTSTFSQVADAIGQVVANYVLLGETGPAVMRKILAQALASIAAEAAVNAVKELALGFATLFFNPAESAGHFVAAGLWASIAGGSALAGRAVAGDLFKPKSSGDSGGRGGSSGSRSERDPIDLFRQQQVQVLEIRIHAEPGARFNDAVVNGVLDSVRSNGPMRTIVKEVAES